MISSTLGPWSRKYSGHRCRIGGALQACGSGGTSAGAAMTTPLEAFAERFLDEFLDLAATLADQADHGDVRVGEARHHARSTLCPRRIRRTGLQLAAATVSSALMARTPVSSGCVIGTRSIG